MAAPVPRAHQLGMALVLALMIVNVCWGLGSHAVSDSDEARYGVAASEMLRTGSLLVPTYGGLPEYWNLKPPLGYWMIELSMWLFGPTLTALRLPSALSAIGVVAVTVSVCRRWMGSGAAVLAGAMLATCFGFLSHHGARSGDLDAMLTLLLFLAFAGIPRLIEGGRRPMWWCLLLAAGFLLKSFAILPAVLVAAAYMAITGQWRRIDPKAWRSGIALLIAIVAGWAVARSAADGNWHFMTRMVREDLLQRAVENIDRGTSSPFSYVESLLDRFAPWSLLAIAGSFLAGPHMRTALPSLRRLLLLWAGVPLVLFSAVQTHHHWYLDPSYPAWAMLAAAGVAGGWQRASMPGRRVLAATLAVGVIGAEARVLWRAAVTDRAPDSQRFLLSLPARLPPQDRTVTAAFALWHSERFLLQVVDGMRVEEPSAAETAGTFDPSRPGVVLLSTHEDRAPRAWTPPPDAVLVAETADYRVIRLPAARGAIAVQREPLPQDARRLIGGAAVTGGR